MEDSDDDSNMTLLYMRRRQQIKLFTHLLRSVRLYQIFCFFFYFFIIIIFLFLNNTKYAVTFTLYAHICVY